MGYLVDNKVKDFVIEQITNKLFDYEDSEIYGCDLAYEIYEGENADGCIFYSTYESKQWIKEYFDDLDEIVEELNFEFGAEYMAKFNPFNEPDKFVLIIVTEVAYYLLGCCDIIKENSDIKIKLTKSKIKKIVQELKQL